MGRKNTDDNTLIRVCVSRSEIDMVQIKEQFKMMFDQDLGKFMAVRACLFNLGEPLLKKKRICFENTPCCCIHNRNISESILRQLHP